MTLKQKAIAGIAWNGIGNIARQALQFVTLIVMARFLSPEDFGVYAILMIFVSFMSIFSDMGTSQVIIHLDKPDQKMLSSIFYFNIVVGSCLFIFLYLLAWPIAYFFKNQNIVHLLQIIGFSFIITAFTLVQKTLLEKSLHFKAIVTLEMIAQTIGSLAGIISAIDGLGLYSLIISSLSNASIFSLCIWLTSNWRPSLRFAFSDIRTIWGYSFNLTGFSIINYFARNADNFLIGKFLGASSLGAYSVAYKIMLYPLDNVSRVIFRVMFPAFSQVKHDNERFKKSYINAISFIALVTFPIMTGLLVVAKPLVIVFFGDKWHGLPILLMILAPIGMLQSIVTTVGSIYLTKGTTRLMFKMGLINAAVTVTSFVIGLPYGVEGVAISYAISNIIMLLPNLKFSWDQIELEIFEGLRKLIPYAFMSIIMAILVYFEGQWLLTEGIIPLFILIYQVAFGAAIYIILIYTFFRKELYHLIKKTNMATV